MRLILQDDDGTAWVVADDIKMRLSELGGCSETWDECNINMKLDCGHDAAWGDDDLASEVRRGIASLNEGNELLNATDAD